MTDKQQLLALAERCEQAAGPDRELDCRIWAALGLSAVDFETGQSVVPDLTQWLAPSYTASLDAAMTLDAPELAQFGGALAFLREALARINGTCLPDGKAALPRFLTAAFLRGRAAAMETDNG